MNTGFPVYTVTNECQDCYKCVRHCPCKAIRVTNGSASVIPELCVACGTCVKVCPAGAKRIRPDLSHAKFLISQGRKVYASIAPSWTSYFQELDSAKLIAVLKKLGFAGVSETALGAQLLSSETGRLLRENPGRLFISPACPATVSYIRKYLPERVDSIVPMLSPLLSHCRFLKKEYGSDIAVVFFGPCAAKKNESAAHPELLDVALTFDDLKLWMKQDGVNFQDTLSGAEDVFVPSAAVEGRLYAVEGGMNETLRGAPGDNSYYLTLSGLNNIKRVLGPKSRLDSLPHGVFIECLACNGGCVNGPSMHGNESSIGGILATIEESTVRNSLDRKVEVDISETFSADVQTEKTVSEEEIRSALAEIGKYAAEDELNCGGCGYPTCRDFAIARLSGKAESAMCLSHLRRMAQKKSNALIKYIPSGVVIADRNLKIIECNEAFASLFGEDTKMAYDAEPGLAGAELCTILEFTELFDTVLKTGKDLILNNQMEKDKIFNVTIFSIEPHQIVGAIIQDVTQTEMRREQIAEKANEVIKKNVETVQKIAMYLGEHMADTEILLHEVASGYKAKPKNPSEQAGG